VKAHVIVPEFPGYGVVGGVAHEHNVNAILKATVKYVVKFLHAPQSRVIIVGRSIGTGPATWLARLLSIQGSPPAALILHSPYTSIRAIARKYIGMASYFLADRWNSERSIVDVACPVLLIHGDGDEIIPHEHSYQLAQTVKDVKARREKEAKDGGFSPPEPKPATISLYIQEGCDHNTFDTERDFLFPIMKFISTKVNPYVWRSAFIRRVGNTKGAILLSTYESPPEELEPMGCKMRVETSMLKNRVKSTHRGPSDEAKSIA
jgi:pimeloyl-ACP methyl ester carboxylesterase